MTESDYKYLQERLSKKSENNPYKHTGCTNYETGYKEGIAAAKSILSEFYHRMERQWHDISKWLKSTATVSSEAISATYHKQSSKARSGCRVSL